MPSTRTLNRSFAGGEMSPEMYGRIDDVKYQTGAAKLRNFIAMPQGPAENRPGFAFVREVKNSAKKVRLIPFTYSTTQTMVIELGDQYIRFHTMGATLMSGASPYEIASPYLEADLFDIHYVQSADVLTLVHPNYAPRELRRLGATNWTLTTVSFTPTVAAPTSPAVAASPGYKVLVSSWASGSGLVTTNGYHNLSEGDGIYASGVTGLADGFYIVERIPLDSSNLPIKNQFYCNNYSGGNAAPAITAYTGQVQYGTKKYDIDNYYRVTAIGANGIDESEPSSEVHVINNLYVTGSYNTISWTAASGAIRYNVYKKQSGLYGYIGQTENTSFVDDNIAPDLGITPPIRETPFTGSGNYPQAVSYFEQRRVFAGTNNNPQSLWMTRSGTESDMGYTLPVKDSDRIAIRVAAREANTIRHIVPLTQLILLTSSAEWRVSPINSDAITPTTIGVRPQSYIGASNVQPSIINNSLVYCAARGGHVRELGYNWQANGFITGDLSLRAAHLFDTFEIADMCYSKAPQPLLWFVSSNGRLIGLTYVPEQQIGAWHWHDTDGLFESCTTVDEGTEDVLYVVVKRTINGATKRYVERLQTREITTLANAFFVDSGLVYDGTNTTSKTMTISGGTTWGPADHLTITASAATFTVGTSDINDAIVLTDAAGIQYRILIDAVTSTTVAQGHVDKILPASLRSTATTVWAFARNSMSGLGHLEGKTVSILADGAVHPRQVVTSGTITLDRAYTKVIAGLPYDSDLQTLPLALNIDGFGQGRFKNINKAWLRVYQSSGIFVGPDEDNLVEAKQRTTEPYGTPPALKSQEILVMLTPTWADSGEVYVRQSDPLPLTIVGMTLEAVIGS